MKAFIVTNPTYSEFRAGEPIAFNLAQNAFRVEKKSHFKKWMEWDKQRVLIDARGDEVDVYLYTDSDPFTFEVMEVTSD